MKILVTGGTGFLGQHIESALRNQGHTVCALAKTDDPAGRVDLLDRAGTDRVRELCDAHSFDALIHLAWNAKPGQFWQSDDNALWLKASRRLLESFVGSGGRSWVIASTCAVYDQDAAASGDCAEDSTPLRPQTPYAEAKAELEAASAEIAAKHGARQVAMRIFQPYGIGEPRSRLVPALIHGLAAGGTVALGPGDRVRDFVEASEFGRAAADLLLSDADGPVNLASGVGVSVATAARLIHHAIGSGRYELSARKPPDYDPVRLVADVKKLHRAIGWTPRRFEETIRGVIRESGPDPDGVS